MAETIQTPPTIEATLSEQEEKFERYRNTIGLGLGPLVALIVYLSPCPPERPGPHPGRHHRWVVVWWIGEPIPSQVAPCWGPCCRVLRSGRRHDGLGPFRRPDDLPVPRQLHPGRGHGVHGLDKRFAYGIMSMSWVGNSSGRILFAFGAICAFLSMWISNTATTAMMFPIGLGIVTPWPT